MLLLIIFVTFKGALKKIANVLTLIVDECKRRQERQSTSTHVTYLVIIN